MKATRTLARVKLLGAILMATCLFVAAANAEPFYRGKFTLPYEVKWGKAVLPAGEYCLTLRYSNGTLLTIVETVRGEAALVVMPARISQHNRPGLNALIIERSSNESTVRELRLAEVGLVLGFEPREPRGRKAIMEARAELLMTHVAVNR